LRAVTLEVEAEDAILSAPMKIEFAATASAGKFVLVPEDLRSNLDDVSKGGAGEIGFSFEIPQGGAYALWARMIAPIGNNAPFHMMTSGSLMRKWTVPATMVWQWHKVAQVFIGAGTFKLEFRPPDDGSRLDKVILSNDLGFVPD
jgi:hypothetical protein